MRRGSQRNRARRGRQTACRAPALPRSGREMRVRQREETAMLPQWSWFSRLQARSSWRDVLRHWNAVRETHLESGRFDRSQTGPAEEPGACAAPSQCAPSASARNVNSLGQYFDTAAVRLCLRSRAHFAFVVHWLHTRRRSRSSSAWNLARSASESPAFARRLLSEAIDSSDV